VTAPRPDASGAFALHRKTLAALSRSAAVGSGDFETSVRDLTELATQVLDCERASVWRLSADRTAIECIDMFERSPKRHTTGTVLTKALAPSYFAAVESQDEIAAHDALTDPRTCEFAESYLGPLGITSMLDIPVFRGEELYGVICHEHIGPARKWTQWDELLGSSVADMLALVLTMSERIAAERALAAHHERLEALVEQRTGELRRAEAGMRSLFEGAPVAVLVVGELDARVLLANKRATDMFEVDRENAAGLDPARLFVDPDDLRRLLERALIEPLVEGHRAQLRTVSGRELWGEVSASSLTFEGAPAIMLGIHDVTKQYAAEATLRERSEFMHEIFTAAPVPLVLTGLDDAVVRFCNARAAEMFELPVEAIVGRRAPDFYVDPTSRETFVERLRADGRVESHPALFKTATAAPFWALMSAHTLDIAGERLFMVGFVNISREKETEAELQRLNDSLSATLRVLEDRDRHIREDLDEAQAFQRLILPTMPADQKLRFAALFRPTAEVGGDIYDVFEMSPGTFRVFIADARGHGVQAALRTMLLKSEYERVRRDAVGPAQALEALNQRICSRYPGMHLQCTAACIDVTPDDRGGARITYSAAANPPFLHITATATHELILSGPHLGVQSDITLDSAEVRLAPGERFLVYTDGLYEQVSASGEMYGVDRMLSDMTIEVPLAEVPARVLSALETFAGSAVLVDDVTLVVVEVCA
jgi:PAS domain S-box-containing protein